MHRAAVPNVLRACSAEAVVDGVEESFCVDGVVDFFSVVLVFGVPALLCSLQVFSSWCLEVGVYRLYQFLVALYVIVFVL